MTHSADDVVTLLRDLREQEWLQDFRPDLCGRIDAALKSLSLKARSRDDLRREIAEYQRLVAIKDPATMAKRAAAKRLNDGTGAAE